MRFSTAISVLLPLLSVHAFDTRLSQVKKAFEAAKIPGNLGIKFDAKILLDVIFPQKAKAPVNVHAGLHVALNDTTLAPVFGISGKSCESPFAVAMLDPDAPSPVNRSLGEVRHFIGGGFSLKGIRDLPYENLVNGTPAVSEFLPPGPPPGRAAHRYIFLLFEQSAAFKTQTFVNASTNILEFNISTFAAAMRLGNPVWGTYMPVAPNN